MYISAHRAYLAGVMLKNLCIQRHFDVVPQYYRLLVETQMELILAINRILQQAGSQPRGQQAGGFEDLSLSHGHRVVKCEESGYYYCCGAGQSITDRLIERQFQVLKPLQFQSEDDFGMLLVPPLCFDNSEIPAYDISLANERRYNFMFTHVSEKFINFR